MRRSTAIAILVALAACGGERAESGADTPVIGGVSAPAVPSPTPEFEIDLWPGEGIPVMHAARDGLPLRERPSPDARRIGTLAAAAGQRIEYDSTRFQTLVPGYFGILSAGDIRGRAVGTLRFLPRERYQSRELRDTTVLLDPESRLEYLQPRAEGTCFVRVQGLVLEANPCPLVDAAGFRLEQEPVTAWWVRARATDGSRGWILVSDSTARVVGRSF